MYFSKLHEDVTFDTWYPGPYTLYGDVLTVGAPVGYKRRISVCPGISAGNNGGGTLRHDLPEDFYKGGSITDFARHFGDCYTDQILHNEALIAFLKEADRRR